MIQTTNALILRSTLFRETSMLFTFLTPDFGKMMALAKGVRKHLHRFCSSFDLFSCNRIVFYERSRSALQLLSQCDLLEPFQAIRSDLRKLAYAVYFTELSDRSTELGDRNGRLYTLLLETLRELSKREAVEETARIFEMKLLSLSGFLPEFSHCQQCGGALTVRCAFSFQKGEILCNRCSRKGPSVLEVSKGTLVSMRHMATSPWELAYRMRISERAHEELDGILKRFLEFHLDEKICSRDFIEELETL